MGIERFFRQICEELDPLAFYPQNGNEWPDTSDITVMTDDINSRIRAYSICRTNESELVPYGMKTWGDVIHKLEAEYLKYFLNGIKTIIVDLDGNTPLAKQAEQHERKAAWEQQMKKDGISPYKWPEVKDITSEEFRKQRWFKDTERPEMGFSDIYYHKPAKIQWINYISEFLLERIVLPTGCRIILDSGIYKCVVLPNPVVVSCEFVPPPPPPPPPPSIGKKRDDEFNVDELVDYGEEEQQQQPSPEEREPKNWTRKIQDMKEEPRYWTYTEADDRLIYWVYRFANEGMIVCSEDGDTLISLMVTYRSRAEAGVVKPLYLRRMNRIGTLADRTPVKQPQIINVNRMADTIHTLFGGLLVSGAQRILHNLPGEMELDGVVLFALLVLMRPNDYESGLSGASPINIFRAAVERPDLCAKMLVCLTHDRDKQGTDKFAVPNTVLVQYEFFRRFVDSAYKQAYMLRERADGVKRPDIYESRYPRPDDDTLRAKAARIAWTLNKICNGGRPGYKIPMELRKDRQTDLPVFGYEQREVDHKCERTGVVTKKRQIEHSKQVAKRVFYGERHASVMPEQGLGVQDTVGDREAAERERRYHEQLEREREEKEERARQKRRDDYREKRANGSVPYQGRPRGGGGGGGGPPPPPRYSRDTYIPSRGSSSSSNGRRGVTVGTG